MVDRDAGRLQQHVLQGAQALVVDLLARDDADGLRRFAQRQVQAGGAGQACVAALALGSAIAQGAGTDGYFTQGGGDRRAGRCSTRLAQYIAAFAAGQCFQARAGQQAGQRLRHRVAAVQARRAHPLQQFGRRAHADFRLDGKAGDGGRQLARRHAEMRLHGGRRGGGIGRHGRCLRQRQQEHGAADGAREGSQTGGMHGLAFPVECRCKISLQDVVVIPTGQAMPGKRANF
ncbi:hypothetical protein D3C81_411990 [compost metagenome]